MKRAFSFEFPKRRSFYEEIDLSKAFAIPQRAVIRITVGALAFVPLMVLAAYLEQWFAFWFAFAWGTFVTLWQVLAYRFVGASTEQKLNITNFYSRGALIFVCIVWTLLITFVVVALYIRAHAP